jgi:raffinose/stachyose/melibiose transport system permease protein
MATPIAVKQAIAPPTKRVVTVYQRRQRMARLFVAPLLILSFVVMLIPTIAGLGLSFTDWTGIGHANFIGLTNYIQIFNDPLFMTALLNNVKWLIIFLTVPILMGLIGAAMLAPIRRGAMLYRVGFFLPYILASLINAQIWKSLYHPQLGVGAWLANQGITFLNLHYLGDTKIVIYSVAFVDNWHWWGFLVLVYLAAMQAIDPELIEVARLEGANRFQEFIHVTLPGIRPTLVFTLLMTVIWSVLAFDYVWALTPQAGPADSAQLLSTAAYTYGILRFQVGYAEAIGGIMALICGMVVLGFVYLRRRGWEI